MKKEQDEKIIKMQYKVAKRQKYMKERLRVKRVKR